MNQPPSEGDDVLDWDISLPEFGGSNAAPVSSTSSTSVPSMSVPSVTRRSVSRTLSSTSSTPSLDRQTVPILASSLSPAAVAPSGRLGLLGHNTTAHVDSCLRDRPRSCLDPHHAIMALTYAVVYGAPGGVWPHPIASPVLVPEMKGDLVVTLTSGVAGGILLDTLKKALVALNHALVPSTGPSASNSPPSLHSQRTCLPLDLSACVLPGRSFTITAQELMAGPVSTTSTTSITASSGGLTSTVIMELQVTTDEKGHCRRTSVGLDDSVVQTTTTTLGTGSLSSSSSSSSLGALSPSPVRVKRVVIRLKDPHPFDVSHLGGLSTCVSRSVHPSEIARLYDGNAFYSDDKWDPTACEMGSDIHWFFGRAWYMLRYNLSSYGHRGLKFVRRQNEMDWYSSTVSDGTTWCTLTSWGICADSDNKGAQGIQARGGQRELNGTNGSGEQTRDKGNKHDQLFSSSSSSSSMREQTSCAVGLFRPQPGFTPDDPPLHHPSDSKDSEDSKAPIPGNWSDLLRARVTIATSPFAPLVAPWKLHQARLAYERLVFLVTTEFGCLTDARIAYQPSLYEMWAYLEDPALAGEFVARWFSIRSPNSDAVSALEESLQHTKNFKDAKDSKNRGNFKDSNVSLAFRPSLALGIETGARQVGQGLATDITCSPVGPSLSSSSSSSSLSLGTSSSSTEPSETNSSIAIRRGQVALSLAHSKFPVQVQPGVANGLLPLAASHFQRAFSSTGFSSTGVSSGVSLGCVPSSSTSTSTLPIATVALIAPECQTPLWVEDQHDPLHRLQRLANGMRGYLPDGQWPAEAQVRMSVMYIDRHAEVSPRVKRLLDDLANEAAGTQVGRLQLFARAVVLMWVQLHELVHKDEQRKHAHAHAQAQVQDDAGTLHSSSSSVEEEHCIICIRKREAEMIPHLILDARSVNDPHEARSAASQPSWLTWDEVIRADAKLGHGPTSSASSASSTSIRSEMGARDSRCVLRLPAFAWGEEDAGSPVYAVDYSRPSALAPRILTLVFLAVNAWYQRPGLCETLTGTNSISMSLCLSTSSSPGARLVPCQRSIGDLAFAALEFAAHSVLGPLDESEQARQPAHNLPLRAPPKPLRRPILSTYQPPLDFSSLTVNTADLRCLLRDNFATESRAPAPYPGISPAPTAAPFPGLGHATRGSGGGGGGGGGDAWLDASARAYHLTDTQSSPPPPLPPLPLPPRALRTSVVALAKKEDMMDDDQAEQVPDEGQSLDMLGHAANGADATKPKKKRGKAKVGRGPQETRRRTTDVTLKKARKLQPTLDQDPGDDTYDDEEGDEDVGGAKRKRSRNQTARSRAMRRKIDAPHGEPAESAEPGGGHLPHVAEGLDILSHPTPMPGQSSSTFSGGSIHAMGFPLVPHPLGTQPSEMGLVDADGDIVMTRVASGNSGTSARPTQGGDRANSPSSVGLLLQGDRTRPRPSRGVHVPEELVAHLTQRDEKRQLKCWLQEPVFVVAGGHRPDGVGLLIWRINRDKLGPERLGKGKRKTVTADAAVLGFVTGKTVDDPETVFPLFSETKNSRRRTTGGRKDSMLPEELRVPGVPPELLTSASLMYGDDHLLLQILWEFELPKADDKDRKAKGRPRSTKDKGKKTDKQKKRSRDDELDDESKRKKQKTVFSWEENAKTDQPEELKERMKTPQPKASPLISTSVPFHPFDGKAKTGDGEKDENDADDADDNTPLAMLGTTPAAAVEPPTPARLKQLQKFRELMTGKQIKNTSLPALFAPVCNEVFGGKSNVRNIKYLQTSQPSLVRLVKAGKQLDKQSKTGNSNSSSKGKFDWPSLLCLNILMDAAAAAPDFVRPAVPLDAARLRRAYDFITSRKWVDGQFGRGNFVTQYKQSLQPASCISPLIHQAAHQAALLAVQASTPSPRTTTASPSFASCVSPTSSSGMRSVLFLPKTVAAVATHAPRAPSVPLESPVRKPPVTSAPYLAVDEPRRSEKDRQAIVAPCVPMNVPVLVKAQPPEPVPGDEDSFDIDLSLDDPNPPPSRPSSTSSGPLLNPSVKQEGIVTGARSAAVPVATGTSIGRLLPALTIPTIPTVPNGPPRNPVRTDPLTIIAQRALANRQRPL